MGNVLVQFSHDKMVQQLAALYRTCENDMRSWLMNAGRLGAFERGEFSEAQFIRLFESEFNTEVSTDAFQKAFADIFILTSGIQPVLQQIRDCGCRMVLLSNTSTTHLQFIEERFEILDYMDERVTSFAAGACKPDPAIYEAALEVAECEPQECFYTDDIADYVEAASNLQIQASQFVSTRELVKDLRRLKVLA